MYKREIFSDIQVGDKISTINGVEYNLIAINKKRFEECAGCFCFNKEICNSIEGCGDILLVKENLDLEEPSSKTTKFY